MKLLLRTTLALLIFGLLFILPSGLSTRAQSNEPTLLPRSPLSGSVLMARAIRSGLIKLNGPVEGLAARSTSLCSPAPCVITPVQASEGGQPVNETPIIASPVKLQNLLTGGNDYNCPSLQGFYASSNAGSTWNHACMNTLPGASGDGDPGVGYNRSNVAFITGLDSGTSTGWSIVFEKSTDNGTSWSAPAAAAGPLFPGGITDKDWLAIDTGASSPHANNLYISNTMFDAAGNTEIAVTTSSNNGATWSTVGVDTKQIYPVVDQFSDMTIGADGTVYLTWQRCTANGPAGDCGDTVASLMFSKSSDGGLTWSTAVKMASAKLAPDACFCGFYGSLPNTNERVSNIPVIGIDNSTGSFSGHLYVAFYKWNGTNLKVAVITSTDGGATWNKGVPVAPKSAANDEFFPWLSVSSTGLVGVTWLDRRNDPSNINYQAFSALSSTGGTRFASNRALTPNLSNPFNDGFGGSFMGDYTGNSWLANGKALFGAWTDTSNGVDGQDEVGALVR